jgi:predicted nucleotidyltransferase
MRLANTEADSIRRMAKIHFGPDSEVMLFGSRTDDRARGGDIDLLVRVARKPVDWYERKLSLLAELKYMLGDQRIDILLVEQGTGTVGFAKEAMAKAEVL